MSVSTHSRLAAGDWLPARRCRGHGPRFAAVGSTRHARSAAGRLARWARLRHNMS